MASKLYGSVNGDSRIAKTQAGSQQIITWVQTEYGRVGIELMRDGAYRVTVTPISSLAPSGITQEIARGNVNLEQGGDAGVKAFWNERNAIADASRARTANLTGVARDHYNAIARQDASMPEPVRAVLSRGTTKRIPQERMHVECLECGRHFTTTSMDPRCTCGSVDIEVA